MKIKELFWWTISDSFDVLVLITGDGVNYPVSMTDDWYDDLEIKDLEIETYNVDDDLTVTYGKITVDESFEVLKDIEEHYGR